MRARDAMKLPTLQKRKGKVDTVVVNDIRKLLRKYLASLMRETFLQGNHCTSATKMSCVQRIERCLNSLCIIPNSLPHTRVLPAVIQFSKTWNRLSQE